MKLNRLRILVTSVLLTTCLLGICSCASRVSPDPENGSVAQETALQAETPEAQTSADAEPEPVVNIAQLELERQMGARLAATTDAIYYIASGNGIMRADLTGDNAELVIPMGSGNIMSLVSDGKHLYYSSVVDMSTMSCEIREAAMDGSADRVVYSGQYSSYPPYVWKGNLYVFEDDVQTGDIAILRVPLDGSDAEHYRTIHPEGVHGFFDAATFANGKFYLSHFSEEPEQVVIDAISLDDGTTTTITRFSSDIERAPWRLLITPNETPYYQGYSAGVGEYIGTWLPGDEWDTIYVYGDFTLNRAPEFGRVHAFIPTDGGILAWPFDKDALRIYRCTGENSRELLFEDSGLGDAEVYQVGESLFALLDGKLTLLPIDVNGNAIDAVDGSQQESAPADSNRFETDYYSVVLPDNMHVEDFSADSPSVSLHAFFYVREGGSRLGDTLIEVSADPDYTPLAPNGYIELAPTSQGYRVFAYLVTNKGEISEELLASYQAK